MDPLTMLVEELLPGAWSSDRLDQLELQGAHVEKGELGPGLGGLAAIVGTGFVKPCRLDDRRFWKAKEPRVRAGGTLNIADDDRHLRHVSAGKGMRIGLGHKACLPAKGWAHSALTSLRMWSQRPDAHDVR